jgi:hypothetical protein
MITPDEALRQAHETAREYAVYGLKAFEDLTGMDREDHPEAAATFVAGFMQAASTDFVGWAMQRQLEGLRDDLDRHVSFWADNKGE